MFLLLQKVFWRNSVSPQFDLRTLAVDALGFSPQHETANLIQKVTHCLSVLLEQGIIELPQGCTGPRQLLTKRAPGKYALRLTRGPYFAKPFSSRGVQLADSPLADPLRSIGFDAAAIGRILGQFPERILAEWADITLAARERRGDDFFTSSAQAYFLDNIRRAAEGRRTPPDWWHALRQQEERQRQEQAAESQASVAEQTEEAALDEYLATEARTAFEQVMDRLCQSFQDQGMESRQARDSARRIARSNLRGRFRREHPEFGRPDASLSL